MNKLISSLALAVVAMTSAAVAAPFDPAYDSRDRAIEAQLARAPHVVASVLPATFDPAATSRDRELQGAADRFSAVATHDAPVYVHVPLIDPFRSAND